MPKKVAPEMSVDQLQGIINNKFGKDTLIRGSDPRLEITRIPSGILSLDVVLGGGFARGRSIEVYGGFSVGKTTCALSLIAQAQARGLRCAFIDCERTYSPEFAAHLGVDIEELDYHRQKSGNQVVDFMETLLRSRLYGVIVLDSIAALIPKQEIEQDMEAGTFGTQQAKLMSVALRRLTTANDDTTVFYINQQRESVGSMFGQKLVTSGGRAMGFYASTRIEMVRIETLKKKAPTSDPKTGKSKETDVVIGHRVLAKITKEKTGAQPMSQTTFVFDYDEACIDATEDLIYLGTEAGLVRKIGDNGWAVEGYEDEKKVGRNNFKKWLQKNKAVAEELEESIREHYGLEE